MTEDCYIMCYPLIFYEVIRKENFHIVEHHIWRHFNKVFPLKEFTRSNKVPTLIKFHFYEIKTFRSCQKLWERYNKETEREQGQGQVLENQHEFLFPGGTRSITVTGCWRVIRDQSVTKDLRRWEKTVYSKQKKKEEEEKHTLEKSREEI